MFLENISNINNRQIQFYANNIVFTLEIKNLFIQNRYKLLKNNYSTVKSIWKSKHCWNKFSDYRHSKTSQKLSDTITEDEKVSQVGSDKSFNSPLYIESEKSENFVNE